VRHVRGPDKKVFFDRQYLVKMKIVIAEIKKKNVVQFIDN
jgi:hypothetical protein